MATQLEEPCTHQSAIEAARKRARDGAGFFGHFTAYAVINLALIAINLTLSPDTLWFVWPVVGWGVAIVFHFFGVFVFGEGTRFEQRLIERELHRHER